jgi:hypothetical protein
VCRDGRCACVVVIAVGELQVVVTSPQLWCASVVRQGDCVGAHLWGEGTQVDSVVL